MFTIKEAYDMLAIHFEFMRNATVAARVYAARFPERHHHSRRFFIRLANRSRRTA